MTVYQLHYRMEVAVLLWLTPVSVLFIQATFLTSRHFDGNPSTTDLSLSAVCSLENCPPTAGLCSLQDQESLGHSSKSLKRSMSPYNMATKSVVIEVQYLKAVKAPPVINIHLLKGKFTSNDWWIIKRLSRSSKIRVIFWSVWLPRISRYFLVNKGPCCFC